MEITAKEYLKSKGIKDTLYDSSPPASWNKGGLSEMMEDFKNHGDISNRTWVVTIECGEDTTDWNITAPNELSAKMTASINYKGKEHNILRCIGRGC